MTGESRKTTLVLGIGILAAIVLLLSQGPDLQFWRDTIGSLTGINGPGGSDDSDKSDNIGSIGTAATDIAAQQEQATATGQTEQAISLRQRVDSVTQIQSLSDDGVKLIEKRKLWEGMLLFDQAINLGPEKPAAMVPLINMATVLDQMGLTVPAKRYIEMARSIDADHPLLMRYLDRDIVTQDIEEFEQRPKLSEDMPVFKAKDNINKKRRVVTEKGVQLWYDETLMIWGVAGNEVFSSL